MELVLTSSFLKVLKKVRIVGLEDLKKLLTKYPHSRDIVQIDHLEEAYLLKCYLAQKQVRAVVLFQYVKNKYVPVSIVKKTSPKGKNITKDNYADLFHGEIARVRKDLKNGNFETTRVYIQTLVSWEADHPHGENVCRHVQRTQY